MSALSMCCDARPIWEDVESTICSRCKDHTSFYDDEVPPPHPDEFSPRQQAIIDDIIASHADDQEGPHE